MCIFMKSIFIYSCIFMKSIIFLCISVCLYYFLALQDNIKAKQIKTSVSLVKMVHIIYTLVSHLA